MTGSVGSKSAAVWALVAATIALHGVPPVLAQSSEAGEGGSVWDGVYAPDQAERGAEIYSSRCLECHPTTQFADPYLETWSGKTLDALFVLIRREMPYGTPGSLSRRESEEVLAYLLQVSGAPAGPADLESRRGALRAVRFDRP